MMNNLTRELGFPTSTVAPQYRGLHKYLEARFADSVVLTFAQIEDLLGFTLPDGARSQPEWWTSGTSTTPASVQSRSWIDAGRSAEPNLKARTVRFDRNGP